jgi:CHAD domain-containing protein
MSQPIHTHIWLLPGKSSIARMHKQLQSIEGLKVAENHNAQILFLDSYDWRLYRKGWSLQASQHGEQWLLNLFEVASGKLLAVSPVGSLPRFISDIPAGVLYKKLYKPLFPRALLTVCELRLKRREYNYQNEEGKQYLRLFLEQPLACLPEQSQGKKLRNWLAVEPVRGYEKEVHKFINLLVKQFDLEEHVTCLLSPCLAAWDVEPTFNDSKPQIAFDYDDPAPQALGRIFISLLETMNTNEAGLVKQIDSEFLHDYRIAIRRTRSLLGQIKHIIPPDKLEIFKNEFAWLSTLTGPARDYDVMLLEFPEYQAMLPEYNSSDYSELWDYLSHKKAEAYDTLIDALQSTRYAEFKQSWQEFLQPDNFALSETCSRSTIGEVANQRIGHIYKRVISEGKSITHKSPIENYHQLRKSCKKLRYLLEMFRSLYSTKKVKVLINELKSLQNNLGELQDLEVHVEILQSFLTQEILIKNDNRMLLTSIQQLVDSMLSRKQTVMDNFFAPFNAFASKKNKQLFAELLGLENT